MKNIFFFLSLVGLLFFPQLSLAETQQLNVSYTVKVASVQQQLFHVTTEVKNISQDSLDISLPVWTPGWYTIENYGKNILRFQITNSKNELVSYQRTRKQSWEITTKGINSIKIDFDYRANILALNQAKISSDFAFFTGTQLFLQVGKERHIPFTVIFDIPNNWKIISALTETSDPKIFTASDYDTLVDSPTEMGNFDLTPFEVLGKKHYFIATPAGTFSKEKSQKFTQLLTKMAIAHSQTFNDLPYDKYLHFYFFARPESNAGGALEHSNSFVAFAPSGEIADPSDLISTASHEFFHLWNVKRIRPSEMWPYDYSRENETPLLWVSEGFTSYYGPLALYRAGIYDQSTFLSVLANLATNIENNEAHYYISPSDSSVSTWLGYDTGTAFEISYYTTGANLGALLDLSIRHDTNGEAGLDDVMRTLYQEHYKKNRGFSTNDLIQVINNITKHNYKDFFQKYVLGSDAIAYETFYNYAGFSLKKNTSKRPVLGISPITNDLGQVVIAEITPNSPAAQAGLQKGDILLFVDDLEPQRKLGQVFQYIADKIDQVVKVRVKRGNEEKSLNVKIGFQEISNYEIIELAQPTPEQLKIRTSWLQNLSKTSKQAQ